MSWVGRSNALLYSGPSHLVLGLCICDMEEVPTGVLVEERHWVVHLQRKTGRTASIFFSVSSDKQTASVTRQDMLWTIRARAPSSTSPSSPLVTATVAAIAKFTPPKPHTYDHNHTVVPVYHDTATHRLLWCCAPYLCGLTQHNCRACTASQGNNKCTRSRLAGCE